MSQIKNTDFFLSKNRVETGCNLTISDKSVKLRIQSYMTGHLCEETGFYLMTNNP